MKLHSFISPLCEREPDIHVLFACESGSRAWGFASEDSDYDVRVIFVRPSDHYLVLDPPGVNIEITTGDVDLVAWDIFKTLRLLRGSNPNVLEWFRSPYIYKTTDVADKIRSYGLAHFSPRRCVHHYLSLVEGHWRKYIDGKDPIEAKQYLYAARSALCARWVINRGTLPPVRFEEVWSSLDCDHEQSSAIRQLVQAKHDGGEKCLVARRSVIDQILLRETECGHERANELPDEKPETGTLNEFLVQALAVGRIKTPRCAGRTGVTPPP